MKRATSCSIPAAAILLATGAAVWVACSDDTCSAGAFPTAPEGRDAIYVAAGCDPDAADGTAEHPFATIQAGIDAAKSGDAVVVAAGTYDENLSIDKPLMVVGSSIGSTADEAGIVVQAPDPNSIYVTATDVDIRGVHVVGAISVGVYVDKAGALTLEDSVIEGTVASPEGKFGYGVFAADDASIVVQRNVVSGSAAVGIAILEAHGIVVQNTVKQNVAGGIRADDATDEVEIRENIVEGNTTFGIGLFSSRAIVVQNEVTHTACDADGEFGDGVVVASLSDDASAFEVTLDTNTVDSNGRVGVLQSGATRGIVVQNTITNNGTCSERSAGIWLQAGAGGEEGIQIGGTGDSDPNVITGNRVLGLGISSDARAIVVQNKIDDTQAAKVFFGSQQIDVGDGVGIFNGASGSFTGNEITGNDRFGFAIDSADLESTSIEDNTIKDNEDVGIVVQNEAAAPSYDTNTYGGNGPDGMQDQEVVAAGTYDMTSGNFECGNEDACPAQ